MPRSLRGPVSRNRWATTDWNALAQSALLLLGVAPGRHQLWRGGKKKKKGRMFSESILNLWAWPLNGQIWQEERREGGDRREEPCLRLGSGWAWVFQSKSAIPRPSKRQINAHTDTLSIHLYAYTTFTHTHKVHTHTLIVKPLPIEALRLLLQSEFAQPWSKHTSVNTLARLVRPLNEQRSRKDLTGDEWRQGGGGVTPACLRNTGRKH